MDRNAPITAPCFLCDRPGWARDARRTDHWLDAERSPRRATDMGRLYRGGGAFENSRVARPHLRATEYGMYLLWAETRGEPTIADLGTHRHASLLGASYRSASGWTRPEVLLPGPLAWLPWSDGGVRPLASPVLLPAGGSSGATGTILRFTRTGVASEAMWAQTERGDPLPTLLYADMAEAGPVEVAVGVVGSRNESGFRGNRLWFLREGDAGWLARELPTDGTAYAPRVIVHDGLISVLWIEDGPGGRSLRASRSPDAGATWGPFVMPVGWLENGSLPILSL